SISTADDEGSTLGLLFLDLNRFKDINDTYGHQYGDAVLQTLAARLDALLGESGMLARLGGDEFAILLPRTGEKEAILAAQRIVSALGEPFMVDGRVFDVGASVGIAVYPAQARDASELMRRADIAMYAAKRGGDGFVVYRPEMEQTNPVRLSLARELRTAIASNQLTLSYQPQVQISTGCADHVEALVRWRHPERGFMPPSTFIPLAEEMGLIGPLTTWVLSEAARQLDTWRDQGLEIRVAVNLSARSLHDPDLVRTVQDCLAAFNVSPSALALEITESAIIIDPDRAMTTARQLHDMGVRLSIDDFGTGYSSLAYLKRLPIDEVKIDRSFVTDVESNADNAFIVRSLIDLAHNLGIQVVGEGVEDLLALAFLQTHGCELAQGYYLSRPLTPERYSAWLAERAT
ncbi:MAG TPA: EAL domain-containing protein, partial [Chloroflexota bacterium]